MKIWHKLEGQNEGSLWRKKRWAKACTGFADSISSLMTFWILLALVEIFLRFCLSFHSFSQIQVTNGDCGFLYSRYLILSQHCSATFLMVFISTPEIPCDGVQNKSCLTGRSEFPFSFLTGTWLLKSVHHEDGKSWKLWFSCCLLFYF